MMGVAEIGETSFRALFEAHYPSLCRRLSVLTGDAALAEDIAQETFLRLYLTPPADLSQPGAWLFRVAFNLAYNQLKRERRRSPLEALAAGRERAVPAALPEEEAIRGEESARVQSALAQLSARDRFALILRHSGYSYAEIASVIKVSPGSVGTILARAQRSFKNAYLKLEGRQ